MMMFLEMVDDLGMRLSPRAVPYSREVLSPAANVLMGGPVRG
jgi:hypothetical protein